MPHESEDHATLSERGPGTEAARFSPARAGLPTPPTFEDIVAAQAFIGRHLRRTPLVRVPGLSELLGCDYFAKCENLQPVGSFKVRGGIHLLGTLPPDEARGGAISASTGNHGLSIAYAGRRFDIRVVIYAPASNVNHDKMQAIRDLGAEVRLHGENFDEARIEAERVAQAEGLRFVHTANEPKLIAGVAGMGLEIFEDLPDAEVILVPVGGGSGAAGNCLVAKHVRPETQVIAVQSERAPAVWRAFQTRSLEPHPSMETIHEGLATRVPFEMTCGILWRLLDDFTLVTDEEIRRGIPLLARHARLVAEGAGAASLAAAIKLKDRLRGKKVVGILTGGNIPMDRLSAALTDSEPDAHTPHPSEPDKDLPHRNPPTMSRG
jgi:threonine dehydratase